MKPVTATPQLLIGSLACIVAGTAGYFLASDDGDPAPASRPEAPISARQDEPGEGEPAPEGEAEGPRHLALNTTSEDHDRLVELGYDVFDVAPEASEIEALPEGGQAMLWVGEFTCEEGFAIPFDEFTGLVDELGGNPRVYGWYLIDEPDPEACPEVVEGIRQRADYINEHASDQLSYVVITDYEMALLHPDNVHVDLYGLDPYPCEIEDEGSCDLAWMDEMMGMALDAGIPREVIVPVVQAFGQTCASELNRWRLPTEAELGQILDRWETLTPNPRLEVSYSWGRQEEWACPALVDADGTDGMPDLQSVMRQHNTAADAAVPAAPADRTADADCTDTTATTATTAAS